MGAPGDLEGEQRVIARFGAEVAHDLVPTLDVLYTEFSATDAHWTVGDFDEMVSAAAERFRLLHPELTDDAVRALAGRYAWQYK